jgi:hypothetical protein
MVAVSRRSRERDSEEGMNDLPSVDLNRFIQRSQPNEES